MEKLMITTQEAAAMFSIPSGTLANMRSQKRGPKYFKFGKRCLYKPEDILKWIERSQIVTLDTINKKRKS